MEQEFDFYITNVKIVVLYKAPLPISVIVADSQEQGQHLSYAVNVVHLVCVCSWVA